MQGGEIDQPEGKKALNKKKEEKGINIAASIDYMLLRALRLEKPQSKGDNPKFQLGFLK